jgi:DinB superfamily
MSLDLNGFRQNVEAFSAVLRAAPAERTAIRLAADKWSLREIVGHLVDSASNNHQRFVRLQDAPRLQFPGYQAERWVEIQRPNLLPWDTLVALWESYNALLLHLAAEVRPECLGNEWETPEGPRTLEFLIADYYRHLRDHAEHFRRRLAELS